MGSSSKPKQKRVELRKTQRPRWLSHKGPSNQCYPSSGASMTSNQYHLQAGALLVDGCDLWEVDRLYKWEICIDRSPSYFS